MRPEGLIYHSEFIPKEDETALIANVERLPFNEVRMHGVVARRMTIHFGWSYDDEGWTIAPAEPPPDFLRPLLAFCAAEADVAVESLEQVMIARYPPDAAIGWHRDAPMFGSPVIGVSLLSACTMRFRRKSGQAWERHAQLLEARSLYILDGAARTQWQHSIPKTKELRYSITMRTLRRKK